MILTKKLKYTTRKDTFGSNRMPLLDEGVLDVSQDFHKTSVLCFQKSYCVAFLARTMFIGHSNVQSTLLSIFVLSENCDVPLANTSPPPQLFYKSDDCELILAALKGGLGHSGTHCIKVYKSKRKMLE